MYDESAIRDFQKRIWHFYYTNKRDMPWRTAEAGAYSPYKIWVSEIMLQQTQVSRVIPKYLEFIELFPAVGDLASAPLSEVLRAWSGLGYNRRAKYLHDAAKLVARDYGGVFPATVEGLAALPGIGVNTAGAILAYAYNQPVVFVETNIRSVIIMYFFEGHSEVAEKDIRAATAAVLDARNPREWYWALMDYGTHLKATAGNHARRAKAYTRQSRFEGSLRKIRGQVLRELLAGPAGLDALQAGIGDERLPRVLEALVAEQMVWFDGRSYSLPEA